MTNRCLPAIPPALWLRGQSTAICTVYLLPEAKNAEYWVSQILAGFCPRASNLYNLTSTTAIVPLLLDLSLPFSHDYLQKLLPPIQSTLEALLFTNYFLFLQMSLSWGKAWAKKMKIVPNLKAATGCHFLRMLCRASQMHIKPDVDSLNLQNI